MVLPEAIHGGNTIEESAAIFLRVLKGEGSWSQNAVVMANAAMALNSTGKFENYDAAYQAAVKSLETGAAYQCFTKLIQMQ